MTLVSEATNVPVVTPPLPNLAMVHLSSGKLTWLVDTVYIKVLKNYYKIYGSIPIYKIAA